MVGTRVNAELVGAAGLDPGRLFGVVGACVKEILSGAVLRHIHLSLTAITSLPRDRRGPQSTTGRHWIWIGEEDLRNIMASISSEL